MDNFIGRDEIESFRNELSEIGRSLRSSFSRRQSSFRTDSALSIDEEALSQWAAIDRLPTFERLRSSVFDQSGGNEDDGTKGKKVVDVTKIGAPQRHLFIEKLIKHIEHDNLKLLRKMRKRIDKVGVKLPTSEVKYTNLCVVAECEVVYGKPLPTLWKSLKSSLVDVTKLPGLPTQEAHVDIINDVSGIIKPGRITLLLGPPGCGKTTLLKALSGNLDKSLKVSGDIMYNGYKLDEFVPHKTSAYISQYDLHIPEITVRETIDFSARCQGTGSRAEIMTEVSRREKEAKIVPDPDIDTYMKAISVEGQKSTLQTDYKDKDHTEVEFTVRDYREDWPLTVTQSVAGNYYPATGGSSITDGEIELMLHVRMLIDDGRGVGEPLDESVCVKDTCEGLTLGAQSERICHVMMEN